VPLVSQDFTAQHHAQHAQLVMQYAQLPLQEQFAPQDIIWQQLLAQHAQQHVPLVHLLQYAQPVPQVIT